MTDVDQSISVSNLGRDNLILRTMRDPLKCQVIPNGVDFQKFNPCMEEKSTEKINIVSVCRQTYRKGTDLIIEVIPEICKKYANVHFIIGGDGPKESLLKDMVNSAGISERVTLKGRLPHHKVRDTLIEGHIFLNTSLTEAFCIAIVEAASVGLYVVATDVGGVGEVLPEDMISLVDPDKNSIITGIEEAIKNYNNIKNQTYKYHERLSNTYNWDIVAAKTVKNVINIFLDKSV
jgi:phosphatidylinositol glycan class A protein